MLLFIFGLIFLILAAVALLVGRVAKRLHQPVRQLGRSQRHRRRPEVITYEEIEQGNEAAVQNALVEAINAVVVDREDVIYESPEGPGGQCLYFNGNHPSCIWGHVFRLLGVPQEMIKERVNVGTNLATIFDIRYNSPVSRAADAAQDVQDGHTLRPTRGTWGDTRDEFLGYLARGLDLKS